MYSINITFLDEHECIDVSHLTLGSQVMDKISSMYGKFIGDLTLLSSTEEWIHVSFLNTEQQIIDEIFFVPIFGKSDYQGLLSTLHNEIQSLQI